MKKGFVNVFLKRGLDSHVFGVTDFSDIYCKCDSTEQNSFMQSFVACQTMPGLFALRVFKRFFFLSVVTRHVKYFMWTAYNALIKTHNHTVGSRTTPHEDNSPPH